VIGVKEQRSESGFLRQRLEKNRLAFLLSQYLKRYCYFIPNMHDEEKNDSKSCYKEKNVEPIIGNPSSEVLVLQCIRQILVL
jgi:hypothetical protein